MSVSLGEKIIVSEARTSSSQLTRILIRSGILLRSRLVRRVPPAGTSREFFVMQLSTD